MSDRALDISAPVCYGFSKDFCNLDDLIKPRLFFGSDA